MSLKLMCMHFNFRNFLHSLDNGLSILVFQQEVRRWQQSVNYKLQEMAGWA